jgi:hypothetical protein
MNLTNSQSRPYTQEDALREARQHVDEKFDLYQAAFAAQQAQIQAVHQREINRRNARKSTGPRTEAGKAASSKNRLSHGLCSRSLLIYGETQEEFDALRKQTHESFAPATPEELFLADQLTEALWRLHRARRVESSAYDIAMDLTDSELSEGGTMEVDQATGPQLAYCFFNEDYRKAFASLQRYVSAADRAYRQCLKALQEAIKRRPEPVAEVPVAVAKPKTAAAGQSFAHEYGFESQLPATATVAQPAIVDLC